MKLRSDVLVYRDRISGGEGVILADHLTGRQFALPAAAGPAIEALRRGLEPTAAGPAGDVDSEELASFLDRLAALHLLEDGTSPQEVRAAVREAQRAERWREVERTLRRARRTTPFYRRKLAGVDLEGLADEADLLAVPLTLRSEVRDHYPDGFVPDRLDLAPLLEAGTVARAVSSGSSGAERSQTIHSREVWRKQMIAGSRLNDEVFAVLDAPAATFTSMHCADPEACVLHLPALEDRIRGGARLLLLPPVDPGAPTLEEAERTVAELRRHRTEWIDCNPTYLATLTYLLVDRGIEPPPVAVITTSFEFQSRIHRRLLSEYWGCNVYDRFTTSELGSYVALECRHGSLHVNDQFYVVEVVRDGRHVPPGEVGRVVATSLREQFGLVRYDTGDLMRAAAPGDCACGSLSPRVATFEGRARDVLVTDDGSPRTPREVDDGMAAVAGLRFYQVAQDEHGQVTLKVVPDPGADASRVERDAHDALHALLGSDLPVRTRRARRIYPELSGKFRFTRSAMPGHEELVRPVAAGPPSSPSAP